MKKLIGIAIAAAFLLLPAVAQAEDWCGEEWDHIHPPPSSSLLKNNDESRLNFVVPSPESGALSYMAMYESTSLDTDFTRDFEYSVGFHLDPVLRAPVELQFGLMFGANATYGSAVHYSDSNKTFDTANNGPASSATRTFDDGTITMIYDASDNYLDIRFFNTLGQDAGGVRYENYYNELMGGAIVFLRGNTSEANLLMDEGEAYYTAFTKKIGDPVAPEPVSSALFLVGGGALALLKRKKK